ncbi:uncharacterized protein LOC122387312 [Amphibalanus amphitrite]|uniref:uncharacterized protein LOC122387312 n=1 Tax=Amphibalanus amphitrite TaxID=1232801 RepID=UPI001C9055CF|nr:uncharacterized protein LOC122387312 [Amphibalanus amphitrite]
MHSRAKNMCSKLVDQELEGPTKSSTDSHHQHLHHCDDADNQEAHHEDTLCLSSVAENSWWGQLLGQNEQAEILQPSLSLVSAAAASTSGDARQLACSGISDLMICAGDWPSPQPATLAVLEPVLGREVAALARRAAGGPTVRKGASLGIANLLWAARRDAVIVARLMEFLEVRRCAVDAAAAASASTPEMEDAAPYTVLNRCRQFCENIGTPPPPAEDAEAAARRARLDRLTRLMSGEQYRAFTAVRIRAAPRGRALRAWLDDHWPAGVPPARGLSLLALQFLLRELVAMLVDACMLVRAETCGEPAGLPTESLTPEHAREAVRRLQMAAPPGADMLLVR